MPFRTRATWPRGTRYQPAADLSASPSAFASSGVISTTSRPPPSSGTRMTMPRPSLVTSSGPSPVRGFIAAILHPLPAAGPQGSSPEAYGTGAPVPAGPASHNHVYQYLYYPSVPPSRGNDQRSVADWRASRRDWWRGREIGSLR